MEILRKISKDFAYKGFQGEKARLCILVKLHSLSPAKGRKLTCLITKPMAFTSQLLPYPVPRKLHLLPQGIISNPSWSKELDNRGLSQPEGAVQGRMEIPGRCWLIPHTPRLLLPPSLQEPSKCHREWYVVALLSQTPVSTRGCLTAGFVPEGQC